MSRYPLRTRFAQNLRRLSRQKRNFAEVSNELGINRQQFNDYLNGRSLPNEQIVLNILRYFNIDISELFSRNMILEAPPLESIYNNNIFRTFDAILKNNRSSRFIKTGLYYVYFPIDADMKYILCSLLAIRVEGSVTTFRRITKIISPNYEAANHIRGIHKGIILTINNRVLFYGFDSANNYAPSLLVGDLTLSSEVFISGISLISAPFDYRNTPFAIYPIGKNTSIGEAMKNVRIHKYDSCYLNSTIVDVLRSKVT